MKPQVVLYKSLPPAELAKLQSHFDVIEFDGVNDGNRAEFIQALTRAEGTIGTGVMMSADLLDRAPKLKAMATISVGIDQFDVDYLSQRGIPLIHTPGVLNETVADTVILLALGAARRAGELSAIVKQGRWVLLAWAASGMRLPNALTMALACRFAITIVPSMWKPNRISAPSGWILKICYKSPTLSLC